MYYEKIDLSNPMSWCLSPCVTTFLNVASTLYLCVEFQNDNSIANLSESELTQKLERIMYEDYNQIVDSVNRSIKDNIQVYKSLGIETFSMDYMPIRFDILLNYQNKSYYRKIKSWVKKAFEIYMMGPYFGYEIDIVNDLHCLQNIEP